MNDEAQPGHTAQSDRIIELTNSAQPMWFSEKLGRDYGQPGGGWTPHQHEATRLTQEAADRILSTSQLMVAPFCKVVAA